MSTMVGTRISDSMMEDVKYLAEEEKADRSTVIRELLTEAVQEKLLQLALEKYAQRKISLGRAAELARIPLADFLHHAAERKIPLNYSLASFRKDLKAVR